MEAYFDHEKLKVYQQAIEFIKWCNPILKKLPRKLAVWNQLDRASTSIVLNIAEGNGKYTPKDRCKYFDIARGSALESAGALDIIITKEYYPKEQINLGKNMLRSIVSMLVLLIKRTSKDRVF